MANETILEFGIINIFADPHPEGIYPKLLERIAHTPAKLWGDDYLALTPPERDAGLWTGRIFVWTELDPNSPAVNTKRLQELSLTQAHVSVPADIGINGRIFYYVLREKDHKIFFETKNEFGKRLAPDRLIGPLDRLFQRINARGEIHVEVNVWPEEDALKNILDMAALAKLEIHIKKPNPDDNDEEAEEILRELEEQGASRKEITLSAKSRKKGMTPNRRTRIEAQVGAETDHVRGAGKDANGNKLDLSTQSYPKIISVALSGFISVLNAAKHTARNTILRTRRPRAEPN